MAYSTVTSKPQGVRNTLTHQPTNFTQTNVPKNQIGNLIKATPPWASWDSSWQDTLTGTSSDQGRCRNPSLSHQSIPRRLPPPPQPLPPGAQSGGGLGPGTVSASRTLPLAVIEPPRHGTPAHCNGNPLERWLNYLSEKMTAALMSLGSGLAAPETAWFIQYPLNLGAMSISAGCPLPCL